MLAPYARSVGTLWLVRLQMGYDRDDTSKNALVSLRFDHALNTNEVRDLVRRAMNNTRSAGHAYTCRHVIEALKRLRHDCRVEVIEEDLVVTDIE